MAQVERSTSTGGKKYLTNKTVTFTDLETGGSTEISGDNITTGNIKSSNYVVDTSGTKINLIDGTIDTKNFKVSSLGKVTATELYLPNGTTKAIDAGGLLTNLDTEGINEGFETTQTIVYGAFFLGYNTDGNAANWGSFLSFDIYIPTGFILKEAKIILIHTPVNWNNGGGYDVWGYCRNLKAYNITNYNNLSIYAAYLSEYLPVGVPTFSEISNSFGASGYTPSVPSISSHLTEITISNDIKSTLIVGTNNKIAVKSSDAVPAFNVDYNTNCSNIGLKTGYVRGILTVIGYYA